MLICSYINISGNWRWKTASSYIPIYLITQSLARQLWSRKRMLGSLSKDQKENISKGPGLQDFLSDDIDTNFNPYKRIKGKRLVLNFTCSARKHPSRWDIGEYAPTQWWSQSDIWSCKCKFFCVYWWFAFDVMAAVLEVQHKRICH